MDGALTDGVLREAACSQTARLWTRTHENIPATHLIN